MQLLRMYQTLIFWKEVADSKDAKSIIELLFSFRLWDYNRDKFR